MNSVRHVANIMACALLACAVAAAQTPLGTAFTYQGRLGDNGVPASGSYDLLFKLFDHPDHGLGIQVGPTLTNDDLAVSDGLINVELDFGAGVFTGDLLWLEISARPGASEESHTRLLPRTALTGAPSALYASEAGNAGTLDGVDSGDFVRASGDTMTGSLVIETSLCLGPDCRSAWPADTTLSEVEVENFVTNGALDLSAATTIGGESISTGDHTAEPFVGQIMLVPWSFCPVGWTEADGKLLTITEYIKLYSVVGTTFGGDGRETFGVPDLRGRLPMGAGQGASLTNRTRGETGGRENVALTTDQMPSHSHEVNASDTTVGNTESPVGTLWSNSDTGDPDYNPSGGAVMAAEAISANGGGQAHENMPPYLVLRYCLALDGVVPQRP